MDKCVTWFDHHILSLPPPLIDEENPRPATLLELLNLRRREQYRTASILNANALNMLLFILCYYAALVPILFPELFSSVRSVFADKKIGVFLCTLIVGLDLFISDDKLKAYQVRISEFCKRLLGSAIWNFKQGLVISSRHDLTIAFWYTFSASMYVFLLLLWSSRHDPEFSDYKQSFLSYWMIIAFILYYFILMVEYATNETPGWQYRRDRNQVSLIILALLLISVVVAVVSFRESSLNEPTLGILVGPYVAINLVMLILCRTVQYYTVRVTAWMVQLVLNFPYVLFTLILRFLPVGFASLGVAYGKMARLFKGKPLVRIIGFVGVLVFILFS